MEANDNGVFTPKGTGSISITNTPKEQIIPDEIIWSNITKSEKDAELLNELAGILPLKEVCYKCHFMDKDAIDSYRCHVNLSCPATVISHYTKRALVLIHRNSSF